MTSDDVRRALIRISHEIVEKHGGTAGLALVGIQTRGVPIAERLAAAIESHEGVGRRSADWTSAFTAMTSTRALASRG